MFASCSHSGKSEDSILNFSTPSEKCFDNICHQNLCDIKHFFVLSLFSCYHHHCYSLFSYKHKPEKYWSHSVIFLFSLIFNQHREAISRIFVHNILHRVCHSPTHRIYIFNFLSFYLYKCVGKHTKQEKNRENKSKKDKKGGCCNHQVLQQPQQNFNVIC